MSLTHKRQNYSPQESKEIWVWSSHLWSFVQPVQSVIRGYMDGLLDNYHLAVLSSLLYSHCGCVISACLRRLTTYPSWTRKTQRALKSTPHPALCWSCRPTRDIAEGASPPVIERSITRKPASCATDVEQIRRKRGVGQGAENKWVHKVKRKKSYDSNQASDDLHVYFWRVTRDSLERVSKF